MQESTKKMNNNSKWQAEPGCNNHVCYGTDCYRLQTYCDVKEGGMAKVSSSESAMK